VNKTRLPFSIAGDRIGDACRNTNRWRMSGSRGWMDDLRSDAGNQTDDE